MSLHDYGYQREARGFSVWTRCPHTGDKRDCLDHVPTRRAAEAMIRRLRAKKEEGRS